MRSRNQGYWVWTEALDLLQGGEQLQRRVFTLETLQTVPCWAPAVDVYEDAGELRVLVALPGVRPEQIDVHLDDGGLVVEGERPMPSPAQHAAIHRLEIPYGRFQRRIDLPSGKYRMQRQFVEDGCLVLVLRRR
mgnify:FL=1